MKKTRGDSVLDKLPKNQRETLERWLFEDNLSYLNAAKKLWEEFNVRASLTSLGRFFGHHSQARLEQRVLDSARKANAVVMKFEETPADIYQATLNLVGEMALRQAMSEKVDVETLFGLTKLMIANRKEEVRSAALDLEREKFQRQTCELFLKWAEDRRAKEIAASPSSNAEKIQQLGALMFGEEWK